MISDNPFTTLQQMSTGFILSRCLHVIADLGVADILDETPRTSTELASLVGANPNALKRMLGLLAAHGIFQAQGDRFSHSEASRLLLSDHPQSMRALVRTFGLPIQWQAYAALEHTLRTGQPAIEKAAPAGLWAYHAEHPEESKIFNDAMVIKAKTQIAGVLAAYDFSNFNMVGDIGGGLGHLLLAILQASPNTKGILFDLPHVVSAVIGIDSTRLILQAGDFFVDPLPACDAYVLMEVLHNWDDSRAAEILQAVHRAASSEARLLIIEALTPDHPGPDWLKTLDIQMMTMLGGMQRTRQQYEVLLNQTGFTFQREIDTTGGISILEAVPSDSA